MNSLSRRANELNIGSSILTRRGGTDANAPESPRKAILRDWHVGILGPHFFGNPGNCGGKTTNVYIYIYIYIYSIYIYIERERDREICSKKQILVWSHWPHLASFWYIGCVEYIYIYIYISWYNFEEGPPCGNNNKNKRKCIYIYIYIYIDIFSQMLTDFQDFSQICRTLWVLFNTFW